MGGRKQQAGKDNDSLHKTEYRLKENTQAAWSEEY